MSVCVVTANLGGQDGESYHVSQTVDYDQFVCTDDGFMPRVNAMHPRLQAKIPKMFAWQMKPGYDFYLWMDGVFSMVRPDTVEYFLDQCKDADLVLFRHHRRPDIRQELRYTRKGVRQTRMYLHSRYLGEHYQELGDLIANDKDYVDDLLLLGGLFMYRNTPEVQAMLKEWWYYVSRYCVQDQISLPYVVKKSGVRVKILEDNLMRGGFPYVTINKHIKQRS